MGNQRNSGSERIVYTAGHETYPKHKRQNDLIAAAVNLRATELAADTENPTTAKTRAIAVTAP